MFRNIDARVLSSSCLSHDPLYAMYSLFPYNIHIVLTILINIMPLFFLLFFFSEMCIECLPHWIPNLFLGLLFENEMKFIQTIIFRSSFCFAVSLFTKPMLVVNHLPQKIMVKFDTGIMALWYISKHWLLFCHHIYVLPVLESEYIFFLPTLNGIQ